MKLRVTTLTNYCIHILLCKGINIRIIYYTTNLFTASLQSQQLPFLPGMCLVHLQVNLPLLKTVLMIAYRITFYNWSYLSFMSLEVTSLIVLQGGIYILYKLCWNGYKVCVVTEKSNLLNIFQNQTDSVDWTIATWLLKTLPPHNCYTAHKW